jgi:hypothetical protein
MQWSRNAIVEVSHSKRKELLKLTDSLDNRVIKRYRSIQICFDNSHIDLAGSFYDNPNLVVLNLAISTNARNPSFLLIKVDKDANFALFNFACTPELCQYCLERDIEWERAYQANLLPSKSHLGSYLASSV